VRKPKYLETDGRHDRWMVSYVDIITILLILFVALAAQAVQLQTVKPVPHPPPTQTVAASETIPSLTKAKQQLHA
jgi:hypothetical protein